MMTSMNARWGGVCGIIAALVLIPAYFAGIPDVPFHNLDASYIVNARSFVWWNAAPNVVFVLAVVPFLAVLWSRVRATGAQIVSSVAITGGTLWVGLASAGVCSEIAFTAASLRFPGTILDRDVLVVFLTMSSWLFSFGQVGLALLIVSTAICAWRFKTFPQWLTIFGTIAVVLVLLRWLLPFPAALVSPVWLFAAAVQTLVSTASPTRRSAGPLTA